MSAARHAIRDAILMRLRDVYAERMPTVVYLGASRMTITSYDGAELHIDLEARLVWCAKDCAQQTAVQALADLVVDCFPGRDGWRELALRQGAELARLGDALQTATMYADTRVAELQKTLEVRLQLIQQSADSACALVGTLEDEIGAGRKQRKRARTASVDDDIEEEEEDDGFQ
jgi:hypothetical protein